MTNYETFQVKSFYQGYDSVNGFQITLFGNFDFFTASKKLKSITTIVLHEGSGLRGDDETAVIHSVPKSELAYIANKLNERSPFPEGVYEFNELILGFEKGQLVSTLATKRIV